LRIFAMYALAAALPLRNFPFRRFGEEDRELERAELRRFVFAVDCPLEEREPFRLRRRAPPTGEPGNAGGGWPR
jgi:hypothetical protein